MSFAAHADVQSADTRGVGHIGWSGHSPRDAICCSERRSDAPEDTDRFRPYRAAVGVGNNDETVPLVTGADGGSWYAVPFSIVPARGQIAENGVEPEASVSGHVLQDDEARS